MKKLFVITLFSVLCLNSSTLLAQWSVIKINHYSQWNKKSEKIIKEVSGEMKFLVNGERIVSIGGQESPITYKILTCRKVQVEDPKMEGLMYECSIEDGVYEIFISPKKVIIITEEFMHIYEVTDIKSPSRS